MANLKSITELPVATSADGVNLIVNDNGYAKQIAAGAVGAQADWSVMDENHPAFVKNKPFYDTREYGTKTFSFDGDITGKEVIEMEPGVVYLVKLYDRPLSKEEIIGSSATVVENGARSTVKITEDMVVTSNTGSLQVGNGLAAVVYMPMEEGPISVSPGIWGMCVLSNGVPVTYISEFSWYDTTGGELKQIEPKYIPEPEWDLDLTVEIYTPDDGDAMFTINAAEGYSYSNIFYKIMTGACPKIKLFAKYMFESGDPIYMVCCNCMITWYIDCCEISWPALGTYWCVICNPDDSFSW